MKLDEALRTVLDIAQSAGADYPAEMDAEERRKNMDERYQSLTVVKHLLGNMRGERHPMWKDKVVLDEALRIVLDIAQGTDLGESAENRTEEMNNKLHDQHEAIHVVENFREIIKDMKEKHKGVREQFLSMREKPRPWRRDS